MTEPAAVCHDLKTWPAFYRDVLDGSKTFEVRRNDRKYRAGDLLRLREWHPDPQAYTGREMTVRVTYVLDSSRHEGVAPGHVVMGIRPEATSSGQTAEHGIDTAAIRADHADPAWSRKHGCAAALRLCDALDRQREETARLQVMAEQASGERYRLRAENMDLRQQRDNARARLDEIRALAAVYADGTTTSSSQEAIGRRFLAILDRNG